MIVETGLGMLYHPLFAKILQGYTNREPVTFSNSTCIGDCEATAIAAGWDVDCHTSTDPYRLATPEETSERNSLQNSFLNGTARPNSTYTGPDTSQTVFKVEVELLNLQVSDDPFEPDFQVCPSGPPDKLGR